ncbi:MAG: Na+/H+ antiporter NhaA [Bacteroidales bacterium]|nr:Na+/H+ antiporter NhaA [Bacteroidales bacterium]MBQ6871097.1 Na+/H+ antiporter NhaA [Bacteroidales bacterium]MBR4095176.1 Na+/H+ antiporter NhaA [Bacteroidales bacterium]
MGKLQKGRVSMTLEARNFFNRFLHNESIGGILLLICAIISLVCANVPELNFLHDIWKQDAGISIGSFSLNMKIEHWINDGLMAIFFFVVGLEIKREMLVGELSSFKHAALPIFAAVGGMIVPALIYSLFNGGTPSANGWGIPMATDIAFAIGILSLLGNRVPVGLKVFLTALAIVDDLGAIIVLAIFYPTHALHFDMLLYAALVAGFLYLLNRNKVRGTLFYIIPGVVLWWLILQSGIHATIAGVILALTIPSKTLINEVRFSVRMKYLLQKFKDVSNSEIEVLANPHQQHIIHQMDNHIEEINPLMHKFESALHPWVTFAIMPIFALANSGVELSGGLMQDSIPPVAIGIFLGLFLGKPIGIFLFSLISVKLKFAELPSGTNWKQVFALGMIAGIGFTMSIFIDSLAFDDQNLVNIGKAAILGTSSIAAILGLLAVSLTCRKKR